MISMNNKLLKEYVSLLIEDDFGGAIGNDLGGLGSFAASDNPFGVSYGNEDALKKVFIDPFLDVGKTAIGKTKEASTRIQTLVKTSVEAILTTLIPVLSSDYNRIFEKEKEELERLKQEYKPVYDATWEAINSRDVNFLAMLYSPKAFFTADFIRKAPAATMQTMSILTGGRLDGFLKKVKDAFHITKKESVSHVFPLVTEAGEKKDIGDTLASSKVMNAFTAAPEMQRAQKAAKSIVQSALAEAYNKARSIANAKSLQDLQRITNKQIDLSKLNSVPTQERQTLEQNMLRSIKDSSKEFIVKNLEAQVDSALKSGVSSDSQYVLDYKHVIEKVRAL